MLFEMVQKTMDLHVLPKLKTITIVSTSFDFGMSKSDIDTFALLVNYLDEVWTHVHVTIGMFEVHETIGNSITFQLQTLLENFGLIHHVIAFVKDESNNLGSMVTTLWIIIDFELLKLLWVYEGTCFGHVMFKLQYVANDDKVFVSFILVTWKKLKLVCRK